MTGNSKQWANYYSLSLFLSLTLSFSPPPPSHRSYLPSLFPSIPPSLALSPPTVEILHWYASEITMETSSLLSSMSGLQRAEHLQPLQTTRTPVHPKTAFWPFSSLYMKIIYFYYLIIMYITDPHASSIIYSKAKCLLCHLYTICFVACPPAHTITSSEINFFLITWQYFHTYNWFSWAFLPLQEHISF